LKEGVKVIASDGKHVGNVDRLLVEPNSSRMSHFVISEGLLFKEHKLIPANWIGSASEDEVHLTVSSGVLERLPAYRS
jgi:uncharacterized protein YrrD